MAIRHLLHVNHLNEFKTYLQKKGFEIEEPIDAYVVLRATHQDRKHPVIVYRRLNNNKGYPIVHLSMMDRDARLVKNFYRERKAP